MIIKLHHILKCNEILGLILFLSYIIILWKNNPKQLFSIPDYPNRKKFTIKYFFDLLFI